MKILISILKLMIVVLISWSVSASAENNVIHHSISLKCMNEINPILKEMNLNVDNVISNQNTAQKFKQYAHKTGRWDEVYAACSSNFGTCDCQKDCECRSANPCFYEGKCHCDCPSKCKKCHFFSCCFYDCCDPQQCSDSSCEK